MHYYNELSDLIGNTPLVKLNHVGVAEGAFLFAKMELFNPTGSVKDRTGKYMVDAAIADGSLKEGGTIIEATAGNTGLGIAFAALNRGFRVIFVVPEKFSEEKLILMRALGAEIVHTPRSEGMLGAVRKAEELLKTIKGAVMMRQFHNMANPKAHYETTGPEIWRDLDGQVDYVVAGAGSGGTYSGVLRYIKEQNPQVKGILADPVGSTIGGGEHGDYEIEGIGNDFIADTMDVSFIGTYYDYRNQLDQMDTLPRNYHEISNRFYERQKAHPNERAEEALTNVLNDMGYETTDEEFVECLFAMGHAVRALMYYFREKVVETLLNGGVKVDVYSDSWKKAPFANHENLRIHPEVSFEESLSVMAESKMSLNVMSWHKGGMTERLNNAMLNKSLCVTDETTYIKREFPEEMLQFNLEDFSDLPDRVKELLDDDAAREAMIRRAYEKAVATQTWECRAKEFLQLLEDI